MQQKQPRRAITRILDAGGILIGKTNLDQFATGLAGVRSPYGILVVSLTPTTSLVEVHLDLPSALQHLSSPLQSVRILVEALEFPQH